VARDGEVLRTPMFMMDALSRSVAEFAAQRREALAAGRTRFTCEVSRRRCGASVPASASASSGRVPKHPPDTTQTLVRPVGNARRAVPRPDAQPRDDRGRADGQ
jgi:hypothetical protein